MEKKKKIKLESIIILIITIGLMWYILKDNFTASLKLLLTSNPFYIILAMVTFFIYYFIEAYILKILINKYNKNYSLKNALNLSIMTKFFNGVTPFSLGGQPLQVYELNKENVSVSDAALIIVENFIVFQITIVSMTIMAFIMNIFYRVSPYPFLWNITLAGFIINIIFLIVVILICVNISLAQNIGYFIIKFFYKIHIVKDLDKVNKKWDDVRLEYAKGFKEIAHNKKIMIKCILLDILCMGISFLVPIFIFKAINSSININVLLCLLLSTYVYMVGSYIPIPGGSVGIEYAFINYFKMYIKESYLAPSVIIWRFVCYYLPMLIGAFVFNFANRENISK